MQDNHSDSAELEERITNALIAWQNGNPLPFDGLLKDTDGDDPLPMGSLLMEVQNLLASGMSTFNPSDN
jgi:hypothetical protein